MLLRLPPIPVRLSGHAVHRAPDTKSNQHPGYGAAGHTDKSLESVPAEVGYRCSPFKSF